MISFLIKNNIIKSNPSNHIALFEKFMVIRFGDEDTAREELKKICKNGILDDDNLKELLRVMCLDKIYDILFPIIRVKGYIDIVKKADEARALIKEFSDDEKKILLKYTDWVGKSYNEDELIRLTGIKWPFKRIIKNALKKTMITSKKEISKELGIEKETLNKWLLHYFGNKYHKSRKISILDYIEIMLKISLKDEEKRSYVVTNIEEYSNRISCDLVHNRDSLLKIEGMRGMNYSNLKENLKLQKMDFDMKKIPFRMKDNIVKKLT